MAYYNSSWADDKDDRRSTSGYVIKLGGGIVSWKSYKQPLVTRSTAEAEYVALDFVTREVIALHRLLLELGRPLSRPTKVYEDNLPAIEFTKGNKINSRSKHIDIRWHAVRQEIVDGKVNIVKIDTKKQIADGLIKAKDKQSFDQFMK